MGNIVSNAAPFGQSPPIAGGFDTSQTAQTPPAAPPSITPPNPNLIESVGPPAPPSGFGVDPFGAQSANSNGELPSLPMDPPLSTGPNLPSITPEPPPPPAPPEPFTPPVDSSQDTRQPDVVALFGKMPDIHQMMKDLEKSGCLLPELQIKSTEHVDTSPLAALQPQRLKDQRFFSTPSTEPQKPVLPDLRLTATGKDQQQHPAQFVELPIFLFVGLISMVQGVQGLAQIAHFIVVTYPTYEQMVITTALTTTDVNTSMIKASIVGLLALIGLIMGVVLLLKRAKNNSLSIYIVVTLIVANFLCQNVLARKELASGNPLMLPQILSETMAKSQSIKEF